MAVSKEAPQVRPAVVLAMLAALAASACSQSDRTTGFGSGVLVPPPPPPSLAAIQAELTPVTEPIRLRLRPGGPFVHTRTGAVTIETPEHGVLLAQTLRWTSQIVIAPDGPNLTVSEALLSLGFGSDTRACPAGPLAIFVSSVDTTGHVLRSTIELSAPGSCPAAAGLQVTMLTAVPTTLPTEPLVQGSSLPWFEMSLSAGRRVDITVPSRIAGTIQRGHRRLLVALLEGCTERVGAERIRACGTGFIAFDLATGLVWAMDAAGVAEATIDGAAVRGGARSETSMADAPPG